MFAVIRTGGKQYKVAKDDVLTIEKVAGEVGGELKLGEVLMLGGDSPRPARRWSRAPRVTAKSWPRARARRSSPSRKKRRKNTHRKRGHRQPFTKIKITAFRPKETTSWHTRKQAVLRATVATLPSGSA
jgi:large subunit ribosomal protein L21